MISRSTPSNSSGRRVIGRDTIPPIAPVYERRHTMPRSSIVTLSVLAFASFAAAQVIYEPPTGTSSASRACVGKSPVLSCEPPSWRWFGLQRAAAAAGREIVTCTPREASPLYFVKSDLLANAPATSDGLIVVPADLAPQPLRNKERRHESPQTRPADEPATQPRRILILPKSPVPRSPEKPLERVVSAP